MRSSLTLRRPLSRRTRSLTVLSVVCALALGSPRAQAEDDADAKEPPLPSEDSAVVVEGDTMWELSERYLGDPYEWPRLWSYNPEVTNPHYIYPGHVMRLRAGVVGGFTADTSFDLAPGESLVTGKNRFGTGFGVRNLFRKDGAILVGDQVYLDNEALQQAGRIVGSKEDHMMMSPTDEVYVKFSKDAPRPREGAQLTVFKHMLKAEVSPHAGGRPQVREGEDKDGEIVWVLGSLRVKSFDDENKIARAEVLESTDPIERGFEVADVPRELKQTPPRPNRVQVQSEIVAATRPLGTLGHNQLVFIGVGKKQGVQPGNRFLVLRRGDAWRDNLTVSEDATSAERPATKKVSAKQFPWETIAEVRVLYVRPESCTGIITNSAEEVLLGDRVEMREGF